MKAFFAGSFNPFTRGHASIVERALRVFDTVVVGLGVNSSKAPAAAAEAAEAIRRLYAGNPRVEVVAYEGLTARAAVSCGAGVLLRGVRSGADYDYEQTLAAANLKMFGIDTLLMPSTPGLEWVSSSLVRELASHGVDTAPLLP